MVLPTNSVASVQAPEGPAASASTQLMATGCSESSLPSATEIGASRLIIEQLEQLYITLDGDLNIRIDAHLFLG